MLLLPLDHCSTIMIRGKIDKPELSGKKTVKSLTVRVFAKVRYGDKFFISKDPISEDVVRSVVRSSGIFGDILFVSPPFEEQVFKSKNIEGRLFTEKDDYESVLGLNQFTGSNSGLNINIYQKAQWSDNPFPCLYKAISLLSIGLIPYIEKYETSYICDVYNSNLEKIRTYEIDNSGYLVLWTPLVLHPESKSIYVFDNIIAQEKVFVETSVTYFLKNIQDELL